MRHLVLFFVAVALTGCQDNSKQIADLQGQLKQNTEKIKELEISVALVEAFQNRGTQLPDEYAVIDCTTPAYDLVRTRLTMLTVACREASKYLDGYKLKLQIGNPSNARLEGLKFTFTPNSGSAKDGLAVQKAKSIVREVTNSFPPGSWTNVEVALPDFPESALKGLEVRVQVNRLGMAGGR